MKTNYSHPYFDTIHEISPKINKYIIQKINKLPIAETNKSGLLELSIKRKGTPIMRSNATYLIYKSFGGRKKSTQLLPALAISELSNQFCYLDNWIFDNKNEVLSNRKKTNSVIASSAILRESVQQTITKLTCSKEIKSRISDSFSNATMLSYIGQLEETQNNNFNQFNSDSTAIKYFETKAKLLSGHLYGFSFELGAMLANKNSLICKKTKNLGIVFGTGLHLSNDVGDFATTEINSFRSYQNQLSDVANSRLTLPIYYILKYGNKDEKKALENLRNNPAPTKKQISLVTSAILSSGSLEKSKKVLKKYQKEFKRNTSFLPNNQYSDAVKSMANTITVNKYIKALNTLNQKPMN